MSDLDSLKTTLLAEIAAAADEAAIEAVRVAALGKKGSVSELLKTLGTMTPEERQTRGAAINALKNEITEEIGTRKTALKDAAINARLKAETLDVSLPVRSSPAERGRIHPISQIVDEITAIFADMGFSIAEGPDIETDYYNFTALNFPEGHPAREMHDTFFLQRTRMVSARCCARIPRRCRCAPWKPRSRRSASSSRQDLSPGQDATHSPMFHQVEGLVIDKTANVGHMRWILEEFCKAFFEVDSVTMRFRPSFFPFTEPSFEVDIQCDRSSGPIVKFGEGKDWMEILGCGMVHPNVLRAGGLDPDEYQGFAWGMGLDRIAMLKYGMPDLRDFFNADVRWMSHYGFRPLDVPTLFGGLSS